MFICIESNTIKKNSNKKKELNKYPQIILLPTIIDTNITVLKKKKKNLIPHNPYAKIKMYRIHCLITSCKKKILSFHPSPLQEELNTTLALINPEESSLIQAKKLSLK